MKNNIYPEGMLTCSVCGKEFKANDDTRYIISGGYTCSPKCFFKEVKEKEAQKRKDREDKNNKKNKK